MYFHGKENISDWEYLTLLDRIWESNADITVRCVAMAMLLPVIGQNVTKAHRINRLNIARRLAQQLFQKTEFYSISIEKMSRESRLICQLSRSCCGVILAWILVKIWEMKRNISGKFRTDSTEYSLEDLVKIVKRCV